MKKVIVFCLRIWLISEIYIQIIFTDLKNNGDKSNTGTKNDNKKIEVTRKRKEYIPQKVYSLRSKNIKEWKCSRTI